MVLMFENCSPFASVVCEMTALFFSCETLAVFFHQREGENDLIFIFG